MALGTKQAAETRSPRAMLRAMLTSCVRLRSLEPAWLASQLSPCSGNRLGGEWQDNYRRHTWLEAVAAEVQGGSEPESDAEGNSDLIPVMSVSCMGMSAC